MDNYNKIYIGVVKNNEDYHDMGRLGVYIAELVNLGHDMVVSYASPFIGSSNPEEVDKNSTKTFEGTQVSYGFWAVPPSINSLVLIAFVNGELSRGYWFACVQQQYMNHMLPNIPIGDSYQHGEDTPVAEYNKADSTPNKHKGKRPYHKVHYESIRNQGLKKDRVRGFSQHGATSKRPSSVMGLLSPKGHYWSVEDTEGDEKIRLRTKSGVQLLLDDTNGIVYFINKTGSGWVEIGATGKIMVYGEEGIAMRTKKDFSIRADRDIIMESGRNIYLHGGKNILTETNNFLNTTKSKYVIYSHDDVNIAGKEMNIDMKESINILSGDSFNMGCDENISINSRNDIALSGNTVDIYTKSKIAISSGDTIDIFGKSDVAISGQAISMNGGGDIAISGMGIDINATTNLTLSGTAMASLSGMSSVVVATSGIAVMKGANIAMNMGGGFIGAKPAISAITAKPANPTEAVVIAPDEFVFYDKQDVTQEPDDVEPIVTILPTIVTTLPSHEPCPEHSLLPEDHG